jgi:hypothetical protein
LWHLTQAAPATGSTGYFAGIFEERDRMSAGTEALGDECGLSEKLMWQSVQARAPCTDDWNFFESTFSSMRVPPVVFNFPFMALWQERQFADSSEKAVHGDKKRSSKKGARAIKYFLYDIGTSIKDLYSYCLRIAQTKIEINRLIYRQSLFFVQFKKFMGLL